MSRSGISSRRRFPSEKPDPMCQEVASTFILLNLLVLQTLQEDANASEYEKFQLQVKDYLDNVNHGGHSDKNFLITEINRVVKLLSVTELDGIMTRPIERRFYCKAIHIRIKACVEAEEQDAGEELQDDMIYENDYYARGKLNDIISIFGSLRVSVKKASTKSHLQQTMRHLKQAIEDINPDIKDAHKFYSGDSYQLRVDSEDTDSEDIHETSISKSLDVIDKRKAANSALAILIPVICTLSAIPACFSSAYGEHKQGKASDSDFFQLLASAPIQLLGTFTALWPIINNLRPNRAAWIQAWALAMISVLLTIAAIPLYLLVSATWSGLSLLAGSIVQSFLQLQLVLGIPMDKIHTD